LCRGSKAWELDGCGNSGPLSKADTTLSEIAAIKTAHGGGVIQGVVSTDAFSVPIPGVHIEAKGAKGIYKVTTNEKGAFQLSVPAGRYVVRASKDGSAFETYFLSYENPRNIRIESGGCAQIQFVEAESQPAR
jgi:hypothetical protein